MFCVECGKEETIFKEGVCLQCYLKTHSFTSRPEFIDIPVCTHCNSYKFKSTWSSEILSEILKRYIKNTFKISNELKKIDINTECKDEKELTICKVYISGLIDDVEILEEQNVKIRWKKTVCDVCSKQFGGYHEAIIQIRADKRDLTDEEINELVLKIEALVENLRAKGNRSLFITDMGKEHGGIDFYLSDKGLALTIINKIHDKYGGEIKKSSKNIGMKDSKQVYRNTYLLRLPPFKKHDFIAYGKSYYLITSISKNKLHIKNLKTWDEQVIDYKNMKKVKIIGGKELVKEMIIVSQKDNEIQVMDKKNYKVFTIRKPVKTVFKDETVKTVFLNDRVFLIP